MIRSGAGSCHDGLMTSRLVVLGSCGAWPEPGRACSGYLLEHDGFRVVLDLGYGTLGRLLEVLGSRTGAGVDAVIVTHKHPDHLVDLHGLFRARWFGLEERLPLYAPDGVVQQLQHLEVDDPSTITDAFAWHELPADEAIDIGPWTLRSWALPHYVTTTGVRLDAEGISVAYTGDTGPDPRLVDLARGVDLLVAEASDRFRQADRPPSVPGQRLHLSARDAGEVAHAAGTGRLLLTHFWPGNDREASRADAAAAYEGEILLADEGMSIPLP